MQMKTTKTLLQTGALAMSLLACSVMAAVSPDEAAKLGTTLTPVGAEMAGNADGSIPAWTGGLPTNAGTADAAGFLSDPFPSEQPLFTITAQNVDQYKDKLTPGQLAMFKRYPETYKMPVFTTHRSATLPDKILAATKENAERPCRLTVVRAAFVASMMRDLTASGTAPSITTVSTSTTATEATMAWARCSATCSIH